MKLQIEMNEKQIKQACLDAIKQRFLKLGFDFNIESLELDSDNMITLTVIGTDEEEQ